MSRQCIRLYTIIAIIICQCITEWNVLQEAIIAQFRRFGEILETIDLEAAEEQSEMASIIIHFRTRREAEGAMLQGKTFGEQPLQLSW